MPHFSLEYSANLEERVDMPALCVLVRDEMLASGLFELGAIRVRAFRAEAYAIADALPENAFLDMSLRIGRGRSEAERKAAGDRIFAAVADHLADLFTTPHFALSLEIREIDPAQSWKKNAMHPRLRAAT